MYSIPENPMIDTKTRICLYYVENDMNLLLVLEKIDGHLGFSIHNAMSKIFSDNTIMYGIHENPMIDTKKLPLLCRK